MPGERHDAVLHLDPDTRSAYRGLPLQFRFHVMLELQIGLHRRLH